MSIDPKFFEDLLIKFMYMKENVRERVLPFLTLELFERDLNRNLINHIFKFMEKYNKFPNVKESKLTLKDEKTRIHLIDHIMTLNSDEYDNDLILNELEEFIKEKMITNVCYDTMVSLSEDGIDKCLSSPDKLRDAISFSFNNDIGLDFSESEEKMFNHFHSKEVYIPTAITSLNDKIGGGFHNKSLSLFLAETNLGKSLIMASLAAYNLLENKNVLYISCELSEEKTMERILTNIFDININEMKLLSKSKFHVLYEKVKNLIKSRFIVKEYPEKTINANTIRNLLKEIELKKKMKPDIIYLDAIGNMNAIHKTKSDNTYVEMGRVTQEVRGVSKEYDVPIVSVIQVNRSGMGASDIDLTNTGDSLGFVQIADIVIGVIQSEEFKLINKYLWKILKNRYGQKDLKLSVLVDYFKLKIMNDDEENDLELNNQNVNENKTKKAKNLINDIIHKAEKDDDSEFIIDFE